MTRARNKDDLLKSSAEKYATLMELIAHMTEASDILNFWMMLGKLKNFLWGLLERKWIFYYGGNHDCICCIYTTVNIAVLSSLLFYGRAESKAVFLHHASNNKFCIDFLFTYFFLVAKSFVFYRRNFICITLFCLYCPICSVHHNKNYQIKEPEEWVVFYTAHNFMLTLHLYW